MTWWQAVILGLVEGLTEYLPVSSTGHLILAAALLGLTGSPGRKAAIDAYTIVIQGGAILAVLGLYRARVLQMLRGLAGRDAIGLRLARNIVVAFLPAAILGVLLEDAIERWLFSPGPVLAALAVGGLVMIGLGPWQRRFFHEGGGDARSYTDLEHLSWRRALVIGLLQCLAMWPGTSRSMTTIVGGMLVGLRPKDAAEFSFLLGLPTLGGACVWKLRGTILGDGPDLGGLGWGNVVLGALVAMLAAMLAVRWLVAYLSKHGVAVFGWYRLALCAAFAALLLAGFELF